MVRRLTVVMLLAFTLLINACASIRQHWSEAKHGDPALSQQPQLSPNRAGADDPRANLDFSLTNLTGGSLKYIYLSPNTSSGWEENILAGSGLKTGDTLNIRFNSNETAMMWDMRIEGEDGRYAEWKNLKLGDISQISLVVKSSPGLTVVAEIE